MGDPRLVVVDPFPAAEAVPVLLGQQRELRRLGLDEPSPSLQGGGGLATVLQLADQVQNGHSSASEHQRQAGQ